VSSNGQKRIAIIGAGVAGMAAAWDLARVGHDVVIYEGGDQPGGLAAGFRDDTWAWSLEKFYHHWFEGDEEVLDLIAEIGKSENVRFPRPKTSYWIDGKVYRSEISPSALLLPLSFFATMRMAIGGIYLKLTPYWKPLERVTADRWLRRVMGEEAYGRFFRPLLIGKFGRYYDQVNMAWFWARVYKRSLRLGTYTGGFQAFLDDLAAAIAAQGARIRLRTPVDRIAHADDAPQVWTADGPERFDAVISTVSPKAMLHMAPGLGETAYGRTMNGLTSIGGVCVVFALRHPVLTDGTYWLNLPATSADKAEGPFPFLAMVEHTNYLPPEHFGGDRIVYCGDYVPPEHEYFSLSDEELVARFMPSLKKVNPDFDESWVRRTWVWRAPYAQPVPFVDHSQHILPVETPLQGVYWASMSQVYPWDRGTNYAVEIGRRAARAVLRTQG
jgi:protoporphyrinogen oxidase